MTINMEVVGLIIEALCMIATVVAVIVAIVANKTSSKSLKYSLKVQEQAKNLDLYEKRVDVVEEIEKNNQTSQMSVKLLFNESIMRLYNEFQACLVDKRCAEDDFEVYEYVMKKQDGDDAYTSPIAELMHYESLLEQYDYPENRMKEFEELCTKNQIVYSETGRQEDYKVYNYMDISKKIGETNRKFNEKKAALLKEMQEFIGNSIASIDCEEAKEA